MHIKSIVLIIPYFGKWPIWFEAYLCSIASNPTIQWLCPTDCNIPVNHPSNITFIPTVLSKLNGHVNKVVGADVPLNPRKFCDLKPAYGAIFYNEIKAYEFWGICDMDIIWGDIRTFITEKVLTDYDIISSRKGQISGHFTLFKNTVEINRLYRSVHGYKELFEEKPFMWFDEQILSNYLISLNEKGKNPWKIYWSENLLNVERGIDSHQEYHLDRWKWDNGRMMNTVIGTEVMYLHFINWKRTMKFCEIGYNDNPPQFYISFDGIHIKPHSKLTHFVNAFKNLYEGYWLKEKRRIRRQKIQSLKKRIKRKLNFIIVK